MRRGESQQEKGQAAVFIAILLMFALIGLTALAIDGGHLYVVRRDLQNMADAACLAAAEELALGHGEEAAYAVGSEYVIRNGGEFFAVWTGPSDNEGSGTGLTWGIEIAGDSVRVALGTEVPTYFTTVFKRSGAGVGAFSHCNPSAGWGPLLPIAVRRYQYDSEPTQQLDLIANKRADPRNSEALCHDDGDCHFPATSIPDTLPSRYGTMDFYQLQATYVPTRTGDPQAELAGNLDCDLSTPEDGIYEGMAALGVHAATNDGTENFTGWISLDIRNIVGLVPPYTASPYYLNNADGQAATNKALSSEWFCKRGWRGRIIPMLGDQLAFLPGVSADFAPKAMMACDPPWEVGDQFIAVVYSGYVWNTPDLEVEITPEYSEISASVPFESHTITYTVTLKKPPESPEWPATGHFLLRAPWDEPNYWFTEPPPEGVTPMVEFEGGDTVTMSPGEYEKQLLMTLTIADPESPTNWVSGLTVEVVETGSGLKRWASTNFGYRADSDFDNVKDFTLYPPTLEFKAVQGAKISVILPTMSFGGFKDKKAPVSVGGPCSAVFTAATCEGGSIRIPSSNEVFDMRVLADAALGQHNLTLDVGGDPSHSLDIVVYIQAPSGGDPTRFVIVEGFADFEISYIDENDVLAYAIGPIVPDISSSLLYGMRPALLPWSQ